MRLRELRIERFGALGDRTFPLDARVLVVFGPNEAGKSSFHAALETLLYGFDPARRDAHPYATWDPDAGPLHVEGTLELDSGARFRAERVLLSSPSLRLAAEGEELAGPRSGTGNAPLPFVQAIPRALFRAVYSLTANDTHFYRDEVRDHVQELLLGEKGVPGARPIRRVRAELAEEVRRLWKADNTGNHRAKQLRVEIRDARRDLREARRAERELAESAEELAALEAELAALSRRRRALAREAEDADFLAQVADLRRRADGTPPLRRAALGGEPMADPVELRAGLESLERELADPRARLARPLPAPPEEDARSLARAEAIAAARREASRHAEELARRDGALEAAGEEERRAHEHLARLGLSSGRPPSVEALVGFPVDALRAIAEHWRAAGARPRAARRPAAIVAGVAGLALLAAVTAGLAPPWLGAVGLAATALALFARPGREHAARPADADRLLEELGLDARAAPDPAALVTLAERLDDARARVLAASAQRARAAELGRKAVARETRWRDLARACGVDSTGDDATLLERLENALERARERAARRRDELAERHGDETAVAARAPAAERVRAELARVEEALAASFPALDPAAAYAAWREAEEEQRYLRRRERELAADPRWPELSGDERLELAGDAAPWSAAAREARSEELTALEDRVAEKEGRLAELRVRLDEDAGSAVARATERVARLEEELAAVQRRRDQLALLERVLAVAERAHRAENQPDVLRRAGEYLRQITGGRYARLDYPGGEESALHVESTERGELVPVDLPLSRGTREQVYLCLRLGTLDYLDQGRESLPIVLDEALVHWDAGRRAQLYPLLERVAERRQVVLFTCHAELAAEARDALRAEPIDLSARPRDPVPAGLQEPRLQEP